MIISAPLNGRYNNQPTTIVTGFEVQFNFLKKFEILKLKNEKLKILKLKFEILKK